MSELQFLIGPLERLGRRERLAYVLERITQLEPGNAVAWRDYALGLANLGQHEEARAVLDRALEVNADDPFVLEFLARMQFSRGEFAEGFRNWEARWWTSLTNRRVAELLIPWWRGEDLRGKRLLLFCESTWGIGDSIQYARYLRPLCQRAEKEGGKIELCAYPRLAEFYQRNFAYNCFTAIPAEAGDYSFLFKQYTESATVTSVLGRRFKSSLRSLALVFGGPLSRRAEGLLSRRPERLGVQGDTPWGCYLRADQEKAAAWRARLSDAEGGTPWRGLKVGLSWTGRDRHPRRDLRDLPIFELVEALRQGAGHSALALDLYSLQLGHSETAKALGLIDWTSELSSNEDTAALLVNLDFVISLDGMIAHLSGALGVPVWVLVDVNPHYTWMAKGHSSPWYGSVRVFRQQKFKSWTSVFDDVRSSLERAGVMNVCPVYVDKGHVTARDVIGVHHSNS